MTNKKTPASEAINYGGAVAILGATLAAVAAHPLAWVAVGYAAYKAGKYAYKEAKARGTMKHAHEEDDFFI
jgi:hypothetical protein